MKDLIATILTLSLISLSSNSMAGTNAFIGPSTDNNCDFDSIQAAMDSGATELKISNAMQYNVQNVSSAKRAKRVK